MSQPSYRSKEDTKVLYITFPYKLFTTWIQFYQITMRNNVVERKKEKKKLVVLLEKRKFFPYILCHHITILHSVSHTHQVNLQKSTSVESAATEKK